MATAENGSVPTRMEFAVEMKCGDCVANVRNVLADKPDIKIIEIDQANKNVLVETTMPSGTVHDILEQTGKTVVFRGHGSSQGPSEIAAAVSHIVGENINGLVRFVQTSEDLCVVDGTIDGLSKGKHGIHINELGDLSNGCLSTGSHYNPRNTHHGNRTDIERHVGDLGNIVSNEDGRAVFRIQDQHIKIWDVIGRSLVVDEKEDTFANEANPGIACGIIARSAGLFQNQKLVCQCSGKTLWQERIESKQQQQQFASQL